MSTYLTATIPTEKILHRSGAEHPNDGDDQRAGRVHHWCGDGAVPADESLLRSRNRMWCADADEVQHDCSHQCHGRHVPNDWETVLLAEQ